MDMTAEVEKGMSALSDIYALLPDDERRRIVTAVKKFMDVALAAEKDIMAAVLEAAQRAGARDLN